VPPTRHGAEPAGSIGLEGDASAVGLGQAEAAGGDRGGGRASQDREHGLLGARLVGRAGWAGEVSGPKLTCATETVAGPSKVRRQPVEPLTRPGDNEGTTLERCSNRAPGGRSDGGRCATGGSGDREAEDEREAAHGP